MKVAGYRGLNIINFDINKYEGLDLSDGFKELASTPEGQEKIKSWCNGVGSEVGFWANLAYHIIPNTIWFLDITCCSDIHDVDYWYPFNFATMEEAIEHKKKADLRLYNNILIHIKKNTTSSMMLWMRNRRAKFYYDMVSNAGEASFLDGKTIGGQKWIKINGKAMVQK